MNANIQESDETSENITIENAEIKRALEDLIAIRRALERSTDQNTQPPAAVRARNLIQWLAFGGATSFLLIELLSGGALTHNLLASKTNSDMLRGGLIFVSIILLALTATLYFIILRAAALLDKPYNTFLQKYFTTFQRASFSSDLFIKFVLFGMFVSARKPELIAPFLSLCTADYLFQSRFFILPFKLATILSLLCLANAGFQLYTENTSLLFPLALFCLVSLTSCLNLKKQG